MRVGCARGQARQRAKKRGMIKGGLLMPNLNDNELLVGFLESITDEEAQEQLRLASVAVTKSRGMSRSDQPLLETDRSLLMHQDRHRSLLTPESAQVRQCGSP